MPGASDWKNGDEEQGKPLPDGLADQIGLTVAARAEGADGRRGGIAANDGAAAEQEDKPPAGPSPIIAFHGQTLPDHATCL
jgi:hypothetical protein